MSLDRSPLQEERKSDVRGKKVFGDRHIHSATARISSIQILVAIVEAGMNTGVVFMDAWRIIAMGMLPLVRLKTAVRRSAIGTTPRTWKKTPNGPPP